MHVADFYELLMAYEMGQLSDEKTTELFQWMLSQGVIWSIPALQRKMAELLGAGKMRVN